MALGDPLSTFLLDKWRGSQTLAEQSQYEAALVDMGYWVLPRPLGVSEEKMREITQCEIYDECDLVTEFETMSLSCAEILDESVRELIAVYAERDQ